MPSGFQQDVNQLKPNFYRVVIDLSSYYPSPSNNSDDFDVTYGAVNPLSWDSFGTEDLPTGVDYNSSAVALAQGNFRFQRIIEELTKLADAQILDVEVVGASNGDTPPSSIAFTVKYDRSEFVLLNYNVLQKSEGLSTNGTFTFEGETRDAYNSMADSSTAINTTELAIRDLVCRGILLHATRVVRVYNSIKGEGEQAKIEINDPTDGSPSNIWSSVTVNPIDGTTLIDEVGDGDGQ